MAVRSKTALSKALLSLMMHTDFDSISISDISDRAGLSRQTFYTNFNKKEDILNYMLTELFRRYKTTIGESAVRPSDFIIDYFLFWDKNKDFLSLLFSRNMGYLFQEQNRIFFMDDTEELNAVFDAEKWQYPYIKASIAGLTYELLHMWISDDLGLSINVLSAVADNLLSGKLFQATA